MSRSYKRKAVDLMQLLTPSIYKEEDEKLSNDDLDITSKVLRGDLQIIENFNEINPTISSVTLQTVSEWDSVKNISIAVKRHFIRKNRLTVITPEAFELTVLSRLGYSLKDYDTSADFSGFLETEVIPKIMQGDGATVKDIYVNASGAFGNTNLESHEYLHNVFGLLYYLLNRTTIEYVQELFVSKIFENKTIYLVDCIKAIKKYIWENSLSNFNQVLTQEFLQGYSQFTSGIQGLTKLDIWTDVLYSENYREEEDTYVKDVINAYFDADVQPEVYLKSGPLYKFQRAVGFLISDIDNQILSLETLISIDECPAELLPYLADIVGWKFYTTNVDSWRRQLRDSRKLLMSKGTKQGLKDLLKSILPAYQLNFDNSFSEYYEGYIPNIIYYLLKTESTLLSSFESWNQDLANSFARSWYDDSDLDVSVRYVVDSILLDCIERFPSLFYMKGYKFDVDNPNFVFNYRSRDFKAPPWEYENFYKDCQVTFDLIEFIKEKLVCLGVPLTYCDSFEDYVLENTVSGIRDPKYYNNGFLFLTEKLVLPPNYQTIMDNYENDKLDYVGLWNSKSSHFNLTISSISFDETILVQNSFTTEDFFEALRAVEDFVPAKTIARLHADLNHTDAYKSSLTVAPRVSFKMIDSPNPSGAMASFEASTLDMRSDQLGLLGHHRNPSFDFNSEKSYVDHSALPVFGREALDFGRVTTQAAYTDSSSVYNVSGPYGEYAVRSSKRRRDLSKALSKGNLFARTGFNQPTFLNLSDTASDGEEFLTLGLVPSSNEFVGVSSHLDLPEVYLKCEDETSNSILNGAATSSTFPVRGKTFNASSNMYRYRDSMEEIHSLIFDLMDAEFEFQASALFSFNQPFFNNGIWLNEIVSLKNELWNESTTSLLDYFDDLMLDHYKKVPNESKRGLHYLYLNNFIKNGYLSISDGNLEDVETGGTSILSHTYGPIFYNASLNLDGSSEGVLFNKNSRSSTNDYLTILSGSSELSSLTTGVSVLGSDERYVNQILNGIEFVDHLSSTENKFAIFNFDDDEGYLNSDSILINNNILSIKSRERNPRIRFTFNYGAPAGNYFQPESNFNFYVSSIFLNETNTITGNGSYDVWIRTEVEQDRNGKEVFWAYTPAGKWEMFDASSISSDPVPLEKLYEITHTVNHVEQDLDDSQISDCYINTTINKSLYNVSKDDLVTDVLKFNTLNRYIKVPLDYYVQHQQVHRMDQKYVIELIPAKSAIDNQYWALNGVRAVNQTFNDRTSITFDFDITGLPVQELVAKINNSIFQFGISNFDILFLRPNFQVLPIGSTIKIGPDGECILETEDGIEQLTIVRKLDDGSLTVYATVDGLREYYLDGNLYSEPLTGSFKIKTHFLVDSPTVFDAVFTSANDIVAIDSSKWMIEPTRTLRPNSEEIYVTSSYLKFTDTGDINPITLSGNVFELSGQSKSLESLLYNGYSTSMENKSANVNNYVTASLGGRHRGYKLPLQPDLITKVTDVDLGDGENVSLEYLAFPGNQIKYSVPDSQFPKLISVGDDASYWSDSEYNPLFSGNYWYPDTISVLGYNNTGVSGYTELSTTSPSSIEFLDTWLSSNKNEGCTVGPCFEASSQVEGRIPIDLEGARVTYGIDPGDSYGVDPDVVGVQPAYTKTSIVFYRDPEDDTAPDNLFVGFNKGSLSLNPAEACPLYYVIPLRIANTLQDWADTALTGREIYKRYVEEVCNLRYGPFMCFSSPIKEYQDLAVEEGFYQIQPTSVYRTLKGPNTPGIKCKKGGILNLGSYKIIFPSLEGNALYPQYTFGNPNLEYPDDIMDGIAAGYKYDSSINFSQFGRVGYIGDMDGHIENFVNDLIQTIPPSQNSQEGIDNGRLRRHWEAAGLDRLEGFTSEYLKGNSVFNSITPYMEPVSVDEEGVGWWKCTLLLPQSTIYAVSPTKSVAKTKSESRVWDAYWGGYLTPPISEPQGTTWGITGTLFGLSYTGAGGCNGDFAGRHRDTVTLNYTISKNVIVDKFKLSDLEIQNSRDYLPTKSEVYDVSGYRRVSVGMLQNDSDANKKVKICSIDISEIPRNKNCSRPETLGGCTSFNVDTGTYEVAYYDTLNHGIDQFGANWNYYKYSYDDPEIGQVAPGTRNPRISLLIDSEALPGFKSEGVKYSQVFEVITTKDLGSNLLLSDSETLTKYRKYYQLNPRQLVKLFRYFKDLSEGIQSRDPNYSEEFHGYNGGGRSNYREHPASFNSTSDWINEGNAIQDLNVEN